MSVNSRLKATKSIGQRKAFYRQRIPGSSCAKKETVDINIREIKCFPEIKCIIKSYELYEFKSKWHNKEGFHLFPFGYCPLVWMFHSRNVNNKNK